MGMGGIRLRQKPAPDNNEWLEPDAVAPRRALFASGRLKQADVVILRRRTCFPGTTMRHGGFAR
jgi:hypothetical protein